MQEIRNTEQYSSPPLGVGRYFAVTIWLALLLQIGSVNALADELAKPTADNEVCKPAEKAAHLLHAINYGVSLPVSIENGVIIIDAMIGTSGPFPMMLDTGSASAITLDVAAKLGLETEGADSVRSSAERTQAVATTHVHHLRLGKAEFDDQPFLELELPAVMVDRGRRPPLAGILGYELFKKFVISIDYQGRRLTLAPPQQFRDPKVGVCVPFTFSGRTPAVHARVDGVPGQFAIDTGSSGALILNRSFIERNGFAEHASAGLKIQNIAVDGFFENIVTRLGRFDIADFTIMRPLTLFPSRQVEGTPFTVLDGMIGSEILDQFVLTFDYSHQHLWLARSSAFGKKIVGGTTGFQAGKLSGSAFRVLNVIPGSPADTVGMKIGDAITEINGVPAARMGTADLARVVSRPNGTTVQLRVLRDGESRIINLSLKELVP